VVVDAAKKQKVCQYLTQQPTNEEEKRDAKAIEWVCNSPNYWRKRFEYWKRTGAYPISASPKQTADGSTVDGEYTLRFMNPMGKPQAITGPLSQLSRSVLYNLGEHEENNPFGSQFAGAKKNARYKFATSDVAWTPILMKEGSNSEARELADAIRSELVPALVRYIAHRNESGATVATRVKQVIRETHLATIAQLNDERAAAIQQLVALANGSDEEKHAVAEAGKTLADPDDTKHPAALTVLARLPLETDEHKQLFEAASKPLQSEPVDWSKVYEAELSTFIDIRIGGGLQGSLRAQNNTFTEGNTFRRKAKNESERKSGSQQEVSSALAKQVLQQPANKDLIFYDLHLRQVGNAAEVIFPQVVFEHKCLPIGHQNAGDIVAPNYNIILDTYNKELPNRMVLKLTMAEDPDTQTASLVDSYFVGYFYKRTSASTGAAGSDSTNIVDYHKANIVPELVPLRNPFLLCAPDALD